MKNIIFIFCMLFGIIQTAYPAIHYKNASQNKMAQQLFDKGMLNYYGYLYVQAEYDFRQALVYDPKCGICYWGLAIAKKQQALELNQPFAATGFEDIQKAASLIEPTNEFQYDIVHAAMKSFSHDPKISHKQLQIDYINSLRSLYQKYKDNIEWKEESLALLVDAIAYYPSVDDPITLFNHCGRVLSKEYKQEAIDLMMPVLKNAAYPDHPGIIHTYIHMTERNLNDPLGEIVAKKLPQFSMGEIPHYTHMPNHIYWRRGMYDKAIQANYDAIAMDKKYFQHHGAGLNSYYYEYHYLHSYHFLTALGILTNNFNLAIENARAVKNMMDIKRIEVLLDYRDTFFSLEHIVLARFNKWDEVLQLEVPPQTHELGLLFIHFSKALAYLNLGQNISYKRLYNQIKNEKYKRLNMQELQTLSLSYLKASEMKLKKMPFDKIETEFLKNNVDKIENKLFVMNPPLWFFPYKLFLAQAAREKGDVKNARKYRNLYEKMYPHSTL